MKHYRILIAGLAGLLALAVHGQAPANLANSRVTGQASGFVNGTIVLRFGASTYTSTFNGSPDSGGNYSYTRTAANTGTVNLLTANNPPGNLQPDNLVLTFTTPYTGTFVNSPDADSSGPFTLALPPAVSPGAAGSVTPTGASLAATINPNNDATVAQFQYGTTTSYGSTATITLSPNNGTVGQNVSVAITGLAANTTYHFRAVATNGVGGTVGDDLTFTTLSAAPVINTQPQSQIAIATSNVTFTVAATGSGLTYQWRKGATDIHGATSATLPLNSVTRASSGTYSVVVTSGGSSTLSSDATLRVIVPQQLTVQRGGGGQFQLLFTDPDTTAATDLSRFEVHHTTDFLGASTAWVTNSGSFTLSNGKILFDDTSSTGTPRRFYRVIEK